MNKTESKIDIYEIDGSEIRGLDKPQLKVSNHWNRRELVCIDLDGKSVTVSASILVKAIENAQNIHKY